MINNGCGNGRMGQIFGSGWDNQSQKDNKPEIIANLHAIIECNGQENDNQNLLPNGAPPAPRTLPWC